MPELFTGVEYTPGQKFTLQPGGKFFDRETRRKRWSGSFAAQQLGLKVGDTFHPVSRAGLRSERSSTPRLYVVTGILAPTNTPADRVIWIPLKGCRR